MQAEYDFSNAKRATDIPHLNRLRAEHASHAIIENDIVQAYKNRYGDDFAEQINKALKTALEIGQ